MAAQKQTARIPELKGLYANSNQFTQPKGTVPRLSNCYMIRRGAFHTVPGSLWVSSWDGTAPHVTNQQPLLALTWFSPSQGSGPAAFMLAYPALDISGLDFIFVLQQASSGVLGLYDASSATLTQLATLATSWTNQTNIRQFSNYLVFAFGPSNPPAIFPRYTQVTSTVGSGDTTINVLDTTAFPTSGYILINSEIIKYTGITPTSFTGLSRGQFGTTATTHAIGAGVAIPTTQQSTNFWLFQSINSTQTSQIAIRQFNFSGPSVPSSGSFLIDSEVISYTGLIPPSFVAAYTLTGVTRGASGSTAAAHGAGTSAYYISGAPVATTPWGILGNDFDPSTVYSQWPGTDNASTAAGAVPVNIGTLIYETDSMGVSWLFRAQNSGVTGWGSSYTGPNFFPSGRGIYGQSVKDFNGANNSGTVVWLNVGQAALPPPGAAFVFQHLDALWLWGVGVTYGPDGITGPDALWQSDTGKPLVFNAAKTTFVGKGDGTSAQGGAVYSLSEAGIAATPQLVLFKDASTYSFLNSFDSSPSLVPVSGGLGCVAPSSVQFIGSFGILRLSYAGFTLFDGQLEHVSEYTDAIRGYLFPQDAPPDITPVDWPNIQNAVSYQCVNPNMYWCFVPLSGGNGWGTRGFGFDFTLKQWSIIDLPFSISAAAFMPQAALVNLAYQTLIGGAVDGAVRRMFYGDPDWDGTPIVGSIRFPDYGFPTTPVYVRETMFRLTAEGGGAAPAYTQVNFAAVERSGHEMTRSLRPPRSLIGTTKVGAKVLSAHTTITWQGQVLIEGTEAITSDLPTARVGVR